MYLVREVMYCKPGKVRPMVDKFLAMAKMMEQAGQGKMLVLTDFVAERFWTIVCEYEIENPSQIMSMEGVDEETMKKMDELMKDYHDYVVKRKREVYKIEGR